MCVTEIWTYSECGCSAEHHIPCCRTNTKPSIPHALLQEYAKLSPLVKPAKSANLVVLHSSSPCYTAQSSPLRQTSSISDTDTVSSSDPDDSCGTTDKIFRTFLEPICDSCVLKEHAEVMALYVEDPSSGAGLVWGSEVNIEIDPQDDLKRSSVLDPFTRESADTASADFPKYSGLVQTRPTRAHKYQQDSPFSTGEDADDEGSLYVKTPLPSNNLKPPTDVRGRPRSRTKQLRRKGIDLSRDELRMSSRWSSGEKKSMENFRDTIREKAKVHEGDELFFGKPTTKRGRPFLKDARAIKDKVAKGFRNGISRSRGRRKGKVILEDDNVAHVSVGCNQGTNLDAPEMLYKPQMSLRQVRSSISMRKMSPSPPPASTSEGSIFTQLCPSQSANTIARHQDRKSSWQSHLQHDLAPSPDRHRIKKAKYLLQEEFKQGQVEERNQRHRILPSDYFPDHNYTPIHESQPERTYSRQNLRQPSSSMSPISQRDLEQYGRLPSLATTTYSAGSAPSPHQPQRMDDIIASGHFESAWWTSLGSRPTSTSSLAQKAALSSTDPNDRSPTSDLLDALKARIPSAADDARPLLRPSYHDNDKMPLTSAATVDSTRHRDNHVAYSRISPNGLISSMSLPEGLGTVTECRYGSFTRGHDGGEESEAEEEGKDIPTETQREALHPLATRLLLEENGEAECWSDGEGEGGPSW